MDSLSDRPPAEALDFVAGALHRLMPLAYALTGNAHDAEDLLQDCLTIVLTKWPKVAQATHRDAYVRRIMVNALTSRRRRRSSQEIPREDGGPERPGLEDTRVEDRDQLVRLLTGLPARQRAVLVLPTWRTCPTRRSPRPSTAGRAPSACWPPADWPPCGQGWGSRRDRTG